MLQKTVAIIMQTSRGEKPSSSSEPENLYSIFENATAKMTNVIATQRRLLREWKNLSTKV